VSDDERKLIADARENRELTQELRDESGLERDDAPPESPEPDEAKDSPDEPWAKTSSGDANDA
jgi:hypothetical protein